MGNWTIDLPAAAPRHRIFELPSAGSGSDLPCRSAAGPGVRPRRARTGQDAQRVGRQGNIERLAGGNGAVRVGDDALHAQLRIVSADQAAGEAVGITAVAFNPDLHARSLALLDHGLHQVHVLGREVRGLHAARVVDHVNAAAVGVNLVDVRNDARLVLLAAPNRPVDGGVFGRRPGKRGGSFGDRRHDNPPPRLVGVKRCDNQGQRPATYTTSDNDRDSQLVHDTTGIPRKTASHFEASNMSICRHRFTETQASGEASSVFLDVQAGNVHAAAIGVDELQTQRIHAG